MIFMITVQKLAVSQSSGQHFSTGWHSWDIKIGWFVLIWTNFKESLLFHILSV